ncbi:DUF1631 domain-containing protein [Alloalcanivorax gelatiniphagus]|mgnify:CR=1 FL=1|uniref:DUF1631 domain-containing protein n=3 Tax=Alloalcanivorax gelatiniphagus TaxID=1194167 RepID=A0ABY2XFW5_9GAMM|nr:DUF1631 domain-containing protein [Alloalcanivorax gelatiniphagus]TMW10488.1 DUF1631 domain-containing protein [Alloalcanivorax gelatiniphagus]|tara:strand:+ start:3404 stop:5698 length:2295 start_codon:yes stop_codon:yes gene_type:complete
MAKVTRLKPVEGGKRAEQARPVRDLPRPLEGVRDHVVQRCGVMLSDMLDGADDTLFGLAEKETDSERDRYFDAMRELRIQRTGIEAGFRRALIDLFQATGQNPESGPRVSDPVDVENLSLVQHDELEISVALDNLGRRARNGCEDALGAFRHRVEYLFEGQRRITEKNNPLEPRNLAVCFAAGLERLSLDIRARLIVIKLFERVVMDEACALVTESNRLMADAGVLPTMKSAPLPTGTRPAPSGAGGRTPAQGQPGADTSTAAPGSAAGGAPAGDDQMFGLLQELLTTLRGLGPVPGAPAGISAPAGPPPASGMAVLQNGVAYFNGAPLAGDAHVEAVSSQDLFGLLTRLQRLEQALEGAPPVDRDLKGELSELLDGEHGEAIHALEQADDDVINLVSMLFDFILDDDGLPSEIKALIGRLQIPLLKVAIADKTFFSNEEHEARLLLNTLARAGSQWDPQQGRDDELYQHIHRSVHAIIDDYDEDAGLFRDLLDQFDAYFRAQHDRAERVAERVREAEEGKALAEQAGAAVQTLLAGRLDGRSVPDVVVRLLRQGWQQVLYLTWLREGPDSDAWRRQAKVVDAVIWSVLPHRGQADLQRLGDLAPKLRRALEHGLRGIEYDPVEARALLDDLAGVHNALLEGLETERVTVPETVRTPPPETPELPDDHEQVVRARALRPGQWVELGDGDEARRAKLAANIRDGAKLVFINRRGIKLCEYTAAGLAAALERGEVRLIEEGALFDRALEAVIGDLRRRHQGTVGDS